MFQINNLFFSYERSPVLNGVSFHVKRCDWLGILGPNGNGKTTLLKCLSGILNPNAGTIELLGKELNKYSRAEVARIIGVVPQDSPILFPFSALDVVLMGRTPYHESFGFENLQDIEIAESVMKLTDTWQFARRSIHELSGGERQRVIIARALAQEPKILLLDEPTAFLDIRHQQDVCNLLRKLNHENGLTIISVMHDINLAGAYCQNIMLIKDGKIANSGSVNDTVTYANLRSVFETEVYVGINDLNGKPYYMPMVE